MEGQSISFLHRVAPALKNLGHEIKAVSEAVLRRD